MIVYKQKKNIVNWFITVLLSTFLFACGSSTDSDLTHYINNIKNRPVKPIEPIPEFKPLPKFTYPEDDNRRSPFKPVVAQQQPDAFAPNSKRPKQPLEAFPLDALKFVGILEEGPLVWALISQPGGLVSRVKFGDYMGQNYGQVVSINQKFIQLNETVQIAGKWKRKPITINLRTP